MPKEIMKTMTFVFIENDHARGAHWSKSVVTAETKEECVEKYFLKYPERRGDDRLTTYDGDTDDIGSNLTSVEPS